MSIARKPVKNKTLLPMAPLNGVESLFLADDYSSIASRLSVIALCSHVLR